eukprot:scaffold4719_cov29-Tisochrysis_lutea.AAC.4
MRTCGSIFTVGISSSNASSAGLASGWTLPTRSSIKSGWTIRWSSAGTSVSRLSTPACSGVPASFDTCSALCAATLADRCAVRTEAPQCGHAIALPSGPNPHSSQRILVW